MCFEVPEIQTKKVVTALGLDGGNVRVISLLGEPYGKIIGSGTQVLI